MYRVNQEQNILEQVNQLIKNMTFEDKKIQWQQISAIEMNSNNTQINELPIEFKYSNSEKSSDNIDNVKIAINQRFLWMRFNNSEWFRPYGNFVKQQILNMINICENDLQIEYLMSMLSLTEGYE